MQPLLYPTVYTTAWGICFSVHSPNGVWRYQLYDERDKSLRFTCVHNQAQFINADFGGLIGNERHMFMSDSSTHQSADVEEKGFIERYLERGFGSMTKNDFEVFIFSELLKDKFVNSSNYQISCTLRIPESKVKRLRYEANLKYAVDIETRSRDAFLKAIDRVKFRKDSKKVTFVIEDITARKYLENKLKEKGSFADFSFNSELIVVTVLDLVNLICECFGEEKKRDIKRRMKSDNQLTFQDVITPVVTKLLGEAGERAVSLGFDAIEDYIKNNS